MKYDKQTGQYVNGKPVSIKEVKELPVWREDGSPSHRFWEEYQKIMKPVFQVKIRPKKNRNNIIEKSKRDRAAIDNKKGK